MLHRVRLCHSLSYDVSPSVCLSVTFRYRDHIGWNASKIISWLNSLRYLLRLNLTSAIWSNGNTPKMGWNRGGVMSTKDCNISQYYDELVVSRIRAFDSYQNQWPWVTLNGRNVTLAEIKQNCLAIARRTARCALYIGLFHPNLVHAYVHYFARIWFWTNLGRSHSGIDRIILIQRSQ